MAHYSMLEDIEDEVTNWGYSEPISSYEQSLNRMESRTSLNGGVGRGRGITSAHHMANIRLAAEINDLKVHPFRMGHLPTSIELLERPSENEITPMLRRLGLSSRDDDVSSSTTRKNLSADQDIRIDGTLPIILNEELFQTYHIEDREDNGIVIAEEIEEFNPELPVHEQFSTIPELLSFDDETNALENNSNPPKQSKPKKAKSKKSKTKKSEATDSTVDSGINTSTSSNLSSTIPQTKAKKKKWRNMTAEIMQPIAKPRGRYEEDYSIGVHDQALNSIFIPRQIIGADGLKDWRK